VAGERVLVVGAGLSGSLMAVYLARAGFEVQILERRGDPRRRVAAAGRSINLAISTRGLHALRQAGLDETILSRAVPMKGRMLHDPEGRLRFQRYGTEEGQAINSVSRLELNIALIEAAAAEPGVSLQFDQRCIDLDLDAPSVTVEDAHTSKRTTHSADRIVGADGAFSAVRTKMQRLDRFDYRQDYLRHGYKELTIPPAADGGFRIEPNALHIWPRGGHMMIALPNQDGSFTCTLFWPFDGPVGFERLRRPEDVRAWFEETYPDALPLMPTLTDDYFRNPTNSLVTVRSAPWHYRDRVALVGDACHAVVPFYGQGANAAFEDCVVLDALLKEHLPDWGAALEAYSRTRKPDVDALADLAIGNFLEMRDHVNSLAFRFKKQAEKVLHRLFPVRFLPLYSMITFSRIPYAEARERSRRQWRLVRTLLAAGAVGLVLLVALLILLV
jgi:kynurenine 3-monooxygenase